ATSMTLQSGKNYRVKQVLKELLHCLGESIQLFASDPKKVMEAYNTHLMNMGQELVFRKQSEWYKGVVEGVNENGQLCMLVEGSRKRYNHRDIEWIV
ncbi:MAG TPA: hypothetical protein PLP34_03065, partial [Chitinophagaceae bacterium]|nr:hypothetical protein [Chitinophagaceae bacterium]